MDYQRTWKDLPDHIIINILTFLPLVDRCSAALSCKNWLECFDDQSLWRRFTFHFRCEQDRNQLLCFKKHGRQLRVVKIYLNQHDAVNRQNACEVISKLSQCDERRLEEISVVFTTENPLFFQGHEFLSGLAELFGPPDPSTKMISTLTKVDLSGLKVTYHDTLLYLLSQNHPSLQELNLQNTSLMCCISPECILTVVRRCKQLTSLSIHYRSISEDVFVEFCQSGHVPLQYLSLACTREEKYHKVLPGESWKVLADRQKKLRVCLKFDHTIERHRILAILHPEIPLVELQMKTMTELYDEVSTAALYYHKTLESLTIVTKGTSELKRALVDLVARSDRLDTLHCYCALDDSTIQKIRPSLKKYTLKTAEEFDREAPTLVGHSVRSAIMSS